MNGKWSLSILYMLLGYRVGWGRGQDPTPIKSSKRAEKRRAALLNCLTSKKNRESENREHFPLLLLCSTSQQQCWSALSSIVIVHLWKSICIWGYSLSGWHHYWVTPLWLHHATSCGRLTCNLHEFIEIYQSKEKLFVTLFSRKCGPLTGVLLLA